MTLAYDAAGRRIQLTLPNGVTTEYTYDAASRLVNLVYRSATGALGDFTYAYDPAGNRIAMRGSLAQILLPDPVTAASYDAANRQITFGGRTMTYDTNGNLATLSDASGTTTYTWDARNRLLALDRPGLAFRATYDTANRRIEQVVNGQTTVSLYDGPDIVQTLTPDGAPVNYLGSLQVDEPLVRGGTENYLTDALGSVVGLVDSIGIVTTEYRYSPFGLTEATGAPSDNPFQFTGREQDATGLYFNRERYYDPVLARFLSEDPLGLSAGVNFYTYVGNNPLGYTDPYGLCEAPPGGGIGICVQTFIPWESVFLGTIKGDNRDYDSSGGTYRTSHWIRVDLQSGTSEAYHDTGFTRGPGRLEDKAKGLTLSESVKVSGSNVIARISGNEPIPTIPLAPGITYDFKIKISDKGEMCVTGSHDGFPAYEIWVYREGQPVTQKPVYGHSPKMTGETAGSLFWPAEHRLKPCQ